MKATKDPIEDSSSGAVSEDAVLRKAVMERVGKVENMVKVDIKPVTKTQYRVNVWAENGKSSDGMFFREKTIVQSFWYPGVKV